MFQEYEDQQKNHQFFMECPTKYLLAIDVLEICDCVMKSIFFEPIPCTQVTIFPDCLLLYEEKIHKNSQDSISG